MVFCAHVAPNMMAKPLKISVPIISLAHYVQLVLLYVAKD